MILLISQNINACPNSHAAERNGRYGSLVFRPTRRNASKIPENNEINSKLSIKTTRQILLPVQIPKKINTKPSAVPALPVAAAISNRIAPGIHPFIISMHSADVNPHLHTAAKTAAVPPSASIQTGILRLRMSRALAARSQHPVKIVSATSILLFSCDFLAGFFLFHTAAAARTIAFLSIRL